MRRLALVLLLMAGGANAEPAVVASGSYPEGLLWHNGHMLFTEMGADQVSIIGDNGTTRPFWRDPGCGPTSIAPFGSSALLVNCHLGHHVVEVSAAGVTGRRFRTANGVPLQDPNASAGDGEGGVYFSDSGIFNVEAPATGRVYHLSVAGVMTQVVGGIKYANGVAFDRTTRTLFVSEHLARRVLALTLDRSHQVTARRVFADLAQHPASRSYSYSEAGPDGIVLRDNLVVVAEYGEGRVHLFDRAGRHLNTLKVPMPFVDTVAFSPDGNLYAGGSFQNMRPPFEGAVLRFAPAEWQPK